MALQRYLDQRLKLQFLRAVDAIDTHRSLLKASASLGLSQPALSKALREQEEALQFRLFERHSRGVSPTEAGTVFVRSARRILAEVRRLNEELEAIALPGGDTVALGVLPIAAAGVVPGALGRLKAMSPDTRVRVQQGRSEELLPLLGSGEIDLIVGRLPDTLLPDGFECEPLWSESVSILARSGHPIFLHERLATERLQRWGLMLPTIPQQVGQEVEDLLEVLGLSSSAPLRSSSYGFIREMLHGTDLLSAMPQLMMAGDLMRGTLRPVPLPVRAPDRPAGLITARGRTQSSAGQAFLGCLRDYVAELAQRGLATAIAEGHS